MTKKEKEMIPAAILVAIIIVSLVSMPFVLAFKKEYDPLENVVSGDDDLFCIMRDGERKINPDMVVDFIDGIWFFVNGSASNCRLEVK